MALDYSSICTKRLDKMSFHYFWLIIVLLTWCKIVSTAAPEEPVKCSNGNTDCIVSNGYGSFPDRSTCHASDIAYPLNENQLISYVRNATKLKRKIKVVTRYGHSFPKLVCPDGEDGLVISTRNLNTVLNVDIREETMTVQSGMTLKQLKDEAANVNLALPYSPYWAGVTVGGMIATGSHGSSLHGLGSAVHEYVVGLTIVSPGGSEDGYVKVRKLVVGDEDLEAVKVSLGVLGVISQVTFKLQPLFKRNMTFITKDDNDLGDKALTFGLEHEFADMVWLPSQRKVIYRVDDRVPVSTPGNGVYDFIPFRSIPKAILESVRGAEEVEESLGLDEVRCANAKAITTVFLATAFGLTNDGKIFTGYPVIGYQNKMQASGECLDDKSGYCGWDPRIKGQFYFSNGFTVPLTKVKSFIHDIQEIVNKVPTSLCGMEMYYGVLMRYVKASSAYLGKDEDGIDFDITYYRSRDGPSGTRLYEDVMDEIEQLAIFKYNALPHWGKNRNVAFEGVIKKYKNGEKFVSVRERYDPLGLFSSEWTDQILGLDGEVTINKAGCAREGLCICSTNSDCGSGYSCQGGRVYTMAKVCRKMKHASFGYEEL